jgi:hypothetical protein
MTKQLQTVVRVDKNRRLIGVFSLFAAGCVSAHAGLLIVPTFDSSITGDPNAAVIEGSINSDIATIDSYIANNVTVNITFQESSSGLGGSSTFVYSPNYTQYYNALTGAQTISPYDAIAIASLPNQVNNPVTGDAGVATVGPLLRALGFSASPGVGTPDTTISLNTSIMNLSRTGPQNPSFYDLQAVTQHEIDEALGIGGTGSELGGGTTGPVGPLDLFRYGAPGVRSYAQGTGISSYFSINGGVTPLVSFNQAGNGSDYGDWAGGTPRVQNAFGTPGSQPNLGSSELTALDVVGWNLTAAGMAVEGVPEPSTVGLVVSGLLGAYFIRRRKS